MSEAGTVSSKDTRAEYETMFILRPDVQETVAKDIQARVAALIAEHQGEVIDFSMDRRRFAYMIGSYREGTYCLYKFYGNGPIISEMNRYLSISKENVLRHMTTRVGV